LMVALAGLASAATIPTGTRITVRIGSQVLVEEPPT
jgi:hypothetical protein